MKKTASSIRLEDTQAEMPQDLHLDYAAFSIWVTRVGGNLISLHRQDPSGFSEEKRELADELQLGFRAFYLAFLAQGFETITLEMSWASWRDLSASIGATFHAPDRINQVKDAASAKMVVTQLEELNEQFASLREYGSADILRPDLRFANDMAGVRPAYDTPCIGWSTR